MFILEQQGIKLKHPVRHWENLCWISGRPILAKGTGSEETLGREAVPVPEKNIWPGLWFFMSSPLCYSNIYRPSFWRIASHP